MLIKSTTSKFYNFLEYVVALCLIISCNSIFETSSTLIGKIIDVCLQLSLIILIFHNISYLRYKIKFYLFLLIFCFYIMVLFISNLEMGGVLLPVYFIKLFIDSILFIVYLLSGRTSKTINLSLFYKFEDIVVFLAISSLVLWSVSRLGILKPNMSITSSWTGYPVSVPGYFGLLFTPQLTRNTSIFVEAPMYSYVLCIALLVNLFLKNNKSIVTWKSIIFILAIFSSNSTTGIIVSIMSLIYKAVISHINIIKKISIIICIPIILLILHIFLLKKIHGENSFNLNSSYNLRMNDVTASVAAWKNHPIIGNGLSNIYAIKEHMYWFRLVPGGRSGISMGFFAILALGGILLSLYYIIPTLLVLLQNSLANKGIAVFNFILLIYTIIPKTSLCIYMFSYLIALCISYKKIVVNYR